MYFEYVEPMSCYDSTPVFTVLSEKDIVDNYYIYYALKYLVDGLHAPSKAEIIENFIVVHWCIEL